MWFFLPLFCFLFFSYGFPPSPLLPFPPASVPPTYREAVLSVLERVALLAPNSLGQRCLNSLYLDDVENNSETVSLAHDTMLSRHCAVLGLQPSVPRVVWPMNHSRPSGRYEGRLDLSTFLRILISVLGASLQAIRTIYRKENRRKRTLYFFFSLLVFKHFVTKPNLTVHVGFECQGGGR